MSPYDEGSKCKDNDGHALTIEMDDADMKMLKI